jgi:hypothetical protein
MTEGIGGSVEAEVRGDCDSRDRTRLRAVRRQRVKEGRSMRRIGTWLRAGGRAAGVLPPPAAGVPQGGVVSPVVANLVLPHGVEAWCECAGRPRRQGRCFLSRFADACVRGCEEDVDARKRMDGLPKRCARFGLRMPPTQTTLRALRKPDARAGAEEGDGPVDFLGLPHSWTRSRRGFWVSKRRRAGQRLRRTQKSLWRWCRTNRHTP